MIRHAMLQDLEQIAALEKTCFPKAEAATKETLKQRMITFPHSFLVMKENNHIIAMINGCITNQKTISDELFEQIELHLENGDYQAIFGLDVHPDDQHHGYAKEMMNTMIKQSREDGRKGLILTCKKHLIGFYEAFGFVHVGISASLHGGRHGMICFWSFAPWKSVRYQMKKR